MSCPDDTFTVNQDICLGIHEKLFAGFFNHVAFTEWRDKDGSWQLGVIGPLGSGKTTLSALTARCLRTHFEEQSKRAPVATIFIKKPSSSNYRDILQRILISILTQLTEPNDLSKSFGHLGLDELQKCLRDTISSVGCAFLIVDDVDICERALSIVKTELPQFQKFGLKVMATSRIPLSFELGADYLCDSNPAHGTVPLCWACRDCYFRDGCFDLDEAFLVCSSCKASGRPCPNCCRTEFLEEPYSNVDLNLTGLIGTDHLAFQDFLAQELEMIHGDLGLNTGIEMPSNSVLGKEIKNTNYDASGILRSLLEAGLNIAVAKVRLSIFQEAQTIEELEKTKDRLPPKFLLLFGAAIQQILRQTESEKQLGLVALSISAEQNERIPFHELEAKLQAVGLLESHWGQPVTRNISRVLRATCGLLSVDLKMDDLWTEPFHPWFSVYVRENYNEDLSRSKWSDLQKQTNPR